MCELCVWVCGCACGPTCHTQHTVVFFIRELTCAIDSQNTGACSLCFCGQSLLSGLIHHIMFPLVYPTGGIITTLVTPAELEFIKAVGQELSITMQEGKQPGTGIPSGSVLDLNVTVNV